MYVCVVAPLAWTPYTLFLESRAVLFDTYITYEIYLIIHRAVGHMIMSKCLILVPVFLPGEEGGQVCSTIAEDCISALHQSSWAEHPG